MTTITPTKTYMSTDFPKLGAMAPMKPKRYLRISLTNKKRVKMSPNDLGFVTRMDKLKAHCYSGHDHGTTRTAAYEKLQDRDEMAKRLTKTRLCWSVEKGVPCPHGEDKCKFAHTKKDVRMAPCLFGERCRFVEWDGSAYCNKSNHRQCPYNHPEESRENWEKRTGLDKVHIPKKSTNKVTDMIPTQVKNKKNVAIVPTHLKIKSWGTRRPKLGFEYKDLLNKKNSDTIKQESKQDQGEESEKDEEEVEEEEVEEESEKDEEEVEENEENEEEDHVCYTVPKAIAMATLEVALAAGATKITITII
ncbi:MAG: hypothetical protein GY861_03605 [bacterium]|nr:hypothetical protein [bacterium]